MRLVGRDATLLAGRQGSVLMLSGCQLDYIRAQERHAMMVIGTVRRSERTNPQMRALFLEVECRKIQRRAADAAALVESGLLWKNVAVSEENLSVVHCLEALV